MKIDIHKNSVYAILYCNDEISLITDHSLDRSSFLTRI